MGAPQAETAGYCMVARVSVCLFSTIELDRIWLMGVCRRISSIEARPRASRLYVSELLFGDDKNQPISTFRSVNSAQREPRRA